MVTSVAILPVPSRQGVVSYEAVAGERRSKGRTPGEALDALATQLPEGVDGALVVVHYGQADDFFTADQQQRLAELMDRWRSAREARRSLDPGEQEELDALVDAELAAAARRAAALAAAAGR